MSNAGPRPLTDAERESLSTFTPRERPIIGPVPTTAAELKAQLDKITPPPPPLPTVGRMVHYHPLALRWDGELKAPLAAVITAIHPNAVALEVFGGDERQVHRGVPFSATPKAGCWSWPPR